MISTLKLAENDGSKASDKILQFGYSLRLHGVKLVFQRKSSKMSL